MERAWYDGKRKPQKNDEKSKPKVTRKKQKKQNAVVNILFVKHNNISSSQCESLLKKLFRRKSRTMRLISLPEKQNGIGKLQKIYFSGVFSHLVLKNFRKQKRIRSVVESGGKFQPGKSSKKKNKGNYFM